jgi:hypothetical protein
MAKEAMRMKEHRPFPLLARRTVTGTEDPWSDPYLDSIRAESK